MSVKTKNTSAPPLLVSTKKYLILLCMFILLTACASTNNQISVDPVGAGTELIKSADSQDHVTLAGKYEHMAADMRTKAHEQREVLENHSFPTRFGKNQKSAKSRIEFKLRQHELAAQEYEEKADKVQS